MQLPCMSSFPFAVHVISCAIDFLLLQESTISKLHMNLEFFIIWSPLLLLVRMHNELRKEQFLQIMNELHSLKKIDGPDPNFKDTCFSSAGRYGYLIIVRFKSELHHRVINWLPYVSDAADLSDIFPTVDMIFDHEQKLSLAPENYLFPVRNYS